MDTEPLTLIRKVWRHSKIDGNVWMPSISNIGKSNEQFRENPTLSSTYDGPHALDDARDWYWTPAVSHGETRRIKKGKTGTNYPAQRVLWVDCDDSYDRKRLEDLRPSFMWETSPGHVQAIWLMRESFDLSEYHRDGFMGMLIQAIGADKSGVDISQLLRVPGTWHHKRTPFKGQVLASSGRVWTRGALLSRVAKVLGFPAGLAAEIGAQDPYGDRSKQMWKFERTAAELGLPQDLTFKILKACHWNKWKDSPDSLRADIESAYALGEGQVAERPVRELEETAETLEELEPWDLATVDAFGPVLRQPMRWVLPGIIPEAGCGLIVAAPKVGKTRIAIEIALGLATGKRPLGLSTRGKQPVGFFSLEDGEYLFADRLAKGMQGSRDEFHWDGHITGSKKNLTWHPPEKMNLFTRFDAIDLSTSEDKQRLYETIQRYGLKLVIIDTLSMAIGDHNVSDQKEMNAVLKDVRRIARATKCAIMFIHHTRKRVFEKGESIQEKILGATALHAWCEFVMSLASPEEDSDLLRLGVQTKMGDHQHYIDHKLKIIKRPIMEEE